MQLFLVDCQFSDIENHKSLPIICPRLESGEMAKSDKTDKFEMLFRVHALEKGE